MGRVLHASDDDTGFDRIDAGQVHKLFAKVVVVGLHVLDADADDIAILTRNQITPRAPSSTSRVEY